MGESKKGQTEIKVERRTYRQLDVRREREREREGESVCVC